MVETDPVIYRYKPGDVIRSPDKPVSEHLIVKIEDNQYTYVCIKHSEPKLVGTVNEKYYAIVDFAAIKVRDATKTERTLYVKK